MACRLAAKWSRPVQDCPGRLLCSQPNRSIQPRSHQDNIGRILDRSPPFPQGVGLPLETAAAVRKLAEVMQEHGLAKIEVSQGGVHILLSAGKPATVVNSPLSAMPVAPAPPPSEPEGHYVTAPMIGTYYASPSPGDPPFVQRLNRDFVPFSHFA